MQIKCPNCNKSFNVNDDMIPSKGRLLQCGSCNNKWFFKKNDIKTFNLEDQINTQTHEKLSKDKNLEKKENIPIEKKENHDVNKIKTNYFNLFLVAIISLISLVILLDTFKPLISNFFPEINIILINLYETIKDITLFFKDLIR